MLKRYDDIKYYENLKCKECGWEGELKKCIVEPYVGLTDYSCPICDKMLLVVQLPFEFDYDILLRNALAIASKAHEYQTRKGGAPYILHPLRVMNAVPDGDAKIVAILHDVVEDSEITLDDLREKMPEEVVRAVDLLTKKDLENYDDYIAKIKHNELARQVKIADLRDNMNITELPELRDKDLKRLQKYHRSYKILTES